MRRYYITVMAGFGITYYYSSHVAGGCTTDEDHATLFTNRNTAEEVAACIAIMNRDHDLSDITVHKQ